jgi:hypothetical protein
MISMAAKCSLVCGWGQDSLPVVQKVIRMRSKLQSLQLTSNQQQSCVHDSGSVQHRGHENVVSRAINEGDMTNQLELAIACWSVAWEGVILGGAS